MRSASRQPRPKDLDAGAQIMNTGDSAGTRSVLQQSLRRADCPNSWAAPTAAWPLWRACRNIRGGLWEGIAGPRPVRKISVQLEGYKTPGKLSLTPLGRPGGLQAQALGLIHRDSIWYLLGTGSATESAFGSRAQPGIRCYKLLNQHPDPETHSSQLLEIPY